LAIFRHPWKSMKISALASVCFVRIRSINHTGWLVTNEWGHYCLDLSFLLDSSISRSKSNWVLDRFLTISLVFEYFCLYPFCLFKRSKNHCRFLFFNKWAMTISSTQTLKSVKKQSTGWARIQKNAVATRFLTSYFLLLKKFVPHGCTSFGKKLYHTCTPFETFCTPFETWTVGNPACRKL